MKKYFSLLMSAAVMALSFTACEEKDPDANGNENENENKNELVYQGVTYKTVTLSNGQTWMAEPLRYVPEGYEPSSDPAENSHIWYPYEIDPDGNPVALTDDASIAANGYLYDLYVALGIDEDEMTAETCETFEGAQGICPDGWHIPTWEEFYALCGKSTKMENGEGAESKSDALFYDEGYDGAKISAFNEAGWNFVFSGTRIKTSFTATGSYNKAAISDKNCTIEDYYGNPSMTYVMTSTFNKENTNSTTQEVTGYQFMSLMSTFTSSYSEGRVTLSFGYSENGQQLRCIKDAE